MKLHEAQQRWADSCEAEPVKDGFVPAANRRPLVNQLRHCQDAEIELVKAEVPPAWSALVKVTPAEPKPHIAAEGDAPLPQPPRRKPFYLFVG